MRPRSNFIRRINELNCVDINLFGNIKGHLCVTLKNVHIHIYISICNFDIMIYTLCVEIFTDMFINDMNCVCICLYAFQISQGSLNFHLTHISANIFYMSCHINMFLQYKNSCVIQVFRHQNLITFSLNLHGSCLNGHIQLERSVLWYQ